MTKLDFIIEEVLGGLPPAAKSITLLMMDQGASVVTDWEPLTKRR